MKPIATKGIVLIEKSVEFDKNGRVIFREVLSMVLDEDFEEPSGDRFEVTFWRERKNGAEYAVGFHSATTSGEIVFSPDTATGSYRIATGPFKGSGKIFEVQRQVINGFHVSFLCRTSPASGTGPRSTWRIRLNRVENHDVQPTL